MKPFIEGKGKIYSEVARGVEANFYNWLRASQVSEGVLLEQIDSGAFDLTFNYDKDKAAIFLHYGIYGIGLPLQWFKENGIPFNSFKVDAALLLMLIASKCSNQSAQKKIRGFVKENLRVK